MILIKNLSKVYPTRHGHRKVIDDVNFHIAPGERIGVLGSNGSGKSTLIRLISGAEQPSEGTVQRKMSVSWPLAFSGGFQGALTGKDNLRFVCRVYGANFRDKLDFVEDFSELGKNLDEPVSTYSAGMRAKLAFALSLSIDFDCLLIDEIVAVGDTRFQQKCTAEVFERRTSMAVLLVSHFPHFVEAFCTEAAILENGKMIGRQPTGRALEQYALLESAKDKN